MNALRATFLMSPHVYVIPDPQPNAFATGRDPQHSTMGVTQGIVQVLPPDELEALAREMNRRG